MKKKVIVIEPPSIKFAGVEPTGKYCFEVRFDVKDRDTFERHQRGVGIYLDPEELWLLCNIRCEVPYVDAKLYRKTNAPTYKEQLPEYEVEVVKKENKWDTGIRNTYHKEKGEISMKASEANKVTREYHEKEKQGYERFLEDIYKEIKRAANMGHYQTAIGYLSTSIPSPNKDQWKAVVDQLKNDGYFIQIEYGCNSILVRWGGGE